MLQVKQATQHSLIAILFIASSAIGLVYETVWFKYLSLLLGNTTYSQSIIITSILIGLAFGATLWGSRIDRVKSPFALFALLQVGLGVYCFIFPAFFEFVRSNYISVFHSLDLPSDGKAVLILKLVTSLILLLPPTILLGGAIPIILRQFTKQIKDSGRNIATVYFMSGFGGIIGSSFAGFILLQLLGLDTSLYLAAALNIMIGTIALFLSNFKTKVQDPKIDNIESPLSSREFTKKEVSIAFIIAGISGLCTMIYGIGWFRLLIPLFGSSTFSFTVILVAFLSGMTLGTLVISKYIDRIKNLFGFLAICQFGVVLSLLATLPLYNYLPFTFWHTTNIVNRTDTAYYFYLIIQFLFSFGIMLLPSMFLGMIIPVATRVSANSISTLGKITGKIFSVNTVGMAIGYLWAVFVFIPLFGIRHTIEVAIILHIIAGIGIIYNDAQYSKIKRISWSGLVLLSLSAYFLFTSDWSRANSLSGVSEKINNNSNLPRSYAAFVSDTVASEILYYKEGSTATVAVVHKNSPTFGKQKVLVINGQDVASSKEDMSTQVLLSQLPALLHKHPESALVIGLGNGVSAGSILSHSLQQIDGVEITPEVASALKYFENDNHHILKDPRFRLYIDDAVPFLNLSTHTYDIIINDPSSGWTAGASNLYTTDFYESCRSHLRPGGMLVQRYHFEESNDETLRIVLRTFQAVFPNVTVWESQPGDIIILGTIELIQPNFEAMKKKLNTPQIKAELENIHINDIATLLSLQILSKYSVEEYADFGDLNSVNFPNFEFLAPQSLFVHAGVHQIQHYDERFIPQNSNVILKKYVAISGLTESERLNIGSFHSKADQGRLPLAYSFLKEFYLEHPDRIDVLTQISSLADKINRSEESYKIASTIVEQQPDNLNALENYGWMTYLHEKPVATAFTKNSIDSAISVLNKCIQLVKDTVDRYHSKLGDIYFGIGNFELALENYRRCLELRQLYPQDPDIRMDILLLNCAKVATKLNQNAIAYGYLVQSYMVNKNNPELYDLSYTLFNKKAKQDAKKKLP